MAGSHQAPRVRITDDGATVEWHGPRGDGQLDLDHVAKHVADAHPRWIGSAADLAERADPRTESRVVEALMEFGRERGDSIALFHDDGRVEYLVEP